MISRQFMRHFPTYVISIYTDCKLLEKYMGRQRRFRILILICNCYLVEGLFELMDALSGSATTLIRLDEQTQFRIPAEIQTLGGVLM